MPKPAGVALFEAMLEDLEDDYEPVKIDNSYDCWHCACKHVVLIIEMPEIWGIRTYVISRPPEALDDCPLAEVPGQLMYLLA